jgi:hypothetical protein
MMSGTPGKLRQRYDRRSGKNAVIRVPFSRRAMFKKRINPIEWEDHTATIFSRYEALHGSPVLCNPI